jgi:hypothetical protein
MVGIGAGRVRTLVGYFINISFSFFLPSFRGAGTLRFLAEDHPPVSPASASSELTAMLPDWMDQGYRSGV